MNKWTKQLIIGAGLGLAVMVGVFVAGDTGSVVQNMRSIRPVYIVAACLLSLCNYFIRFIKWHFFLSKLNIEASIPNSFVTFMSGLSMSATPGKLGELLKAFILKSCEGTPVAKTTSVVIAERLTDAIGLLILAGLGSSFFSYGRRALAIITLICIVSITLFKQKPFAQFTLNILKRWPKIRKASDSLTTFYTSANVLFTARTLTVTSAVSAVSWSMEGIAFYLILSGLGLRQSIGESIFIFSFSSLLGAISMLPGGLGAADASLMGLLTLQGVNKGSAGAAAFLVRLATLWLAVIIGLFFLLYTVGNGKYNRNSNNTLRYPND